MPGRTAERLRAAALPAEGSLSTAFSALADPVRLRMFALLRQREQCVCHLTEALGLSQGTVSHHIGMLKRAGLVRDRRDPDDSRWVYYRLDLHGIAALRAMLEAALDTSAVDPTPANCCDPVDDLDHQLGARGCRP